MESVIEECQQPDMIRRCTHRPRRRRSSVMISNALHAGSFVTYTMIARHNFSRRRHRDVVPEHTDTVYDADIALSKTKRKAAMHARQDLGEELVALDARRLSELAAELSLPEPLVEAIADARTISAWGARKRQLQYI